MTEQIQPIIRKSFGLKEEVRPQLQASYHSPLIDRIKKEGYRLEAGDLTIRLAEEFGFCYGVDRAVDYAYETRAKFPGKRIFLTNEIIHNPRVNTKLLEMGIQFLYGPYQSENSVEDITQAAYHGVTIKDATLYTTFSPCLICTKMIINSGIREVVYNVEYELSETARGLLQEAGIHVRQLAISPAFSGEDLP